MVAPLVRPSGVLGILEVMSGRPAAFAERDQRTLEVLASRALRNVERAADPFLLRAEASVPTRSVSPREHPPAPAFDERSFHESSLRAPSFDESGVHESSFNEPTFAAPFSGPIFGRPASVAPARPRVDLLTWLLGLIVLAGVVLLGVLTSRRLGWNLPTWSAQAAKISSPGASQRPDPGAQSAPAPADPVTASTAPEASSASASAATEPTLAGDPASNVPAPPPAGVPGGGLRVFENGKEVFRLPATQPRPASRPMGESQSRIIELTPAAAEAILIHRVEPEYPEQARARQLQGKVVLKIRVRPDGTVEDLQLVSGPPLLAQAAIDAVQRWTFKPQLESGDPVEMRTQVTLNFRLP
jgi:protein TonB